MDEETAIIANNTRNEKIRNFFTNNKKILITLVSTVIVLIIGYFAFAEYEEKKKLKISDQYNSIVTEYTFKDKETTKNILIELIKKKDSTYSPLSLYFIIDNQLISDELIINNLFDIIIEDVYLKKEIKNLIIYKKALYNADNSTEYEILETLKPIINTNSVWKSHALYLIGEYFYSKNEKQKAKEFFIQIISLKNANQEIKTESQKRLNRDLSE
jgi:predicted negative regulator of RcsB-dependent stress response|tara:strand:- start:477 stop:1121 length:645 start_codon:yes stop_codon:yes gene_type:complete